MDFRDHYAVLGIELSSPPEEIARAYRRLARQHHPDLNPHDAEAEARFKEINEAYAVLSDPEKRAQYDLLLAGSQPAWSPELSATGPSRDEQPVSHEHAGFAQQEGIQWAGEDLSALLGQMANDLASELQEALRGFGAELDSLSRTFRATVPDRLGRQGFPPPPPNIQPPKGGRPPRNGRPPYDGKAPKP
jgi:curved DNA-binding protein CbpA